MYCQECGNKLPATAKFCMNCGTKVWVEEAVEEVKEAEATVEESKTEEPLEDVCETEAEEYAVTEEPAVGGDVNLEAEQAIPTVVMLKKLSEKPERLIKNCLL